MESSSADRAPDETRRRALITGIGGQDGSFLAELLLEQGYAVYGVTRRDPTEAIENLAAVQHRIGLIQADLLDQISLVNALNECRPHEVYNLASVSFVPASWKQPVLTAQFAAVGVTSMLEAIRLVDPTIRFYQASSSEVFGEPLLMPQTETTPLVPLTPYGVAKAYGHHIVRSYRVRYGIYACSGILYNHESWRRPPEFVTRKITMGAAAISLGLATELRLGDVESRRDWGFAGDYVRAMWLMLQQETPDDFVIASGITHRVADIAEWAFSKVGLDWREHVRTDASLLRGTAELHRLVGDPTKARRMLGWEPTTDLRALVERMVEEDVRRLVATEGRSVTAATGDAAQGLV